MNKQFTDTEIMAACEAWPGLHQHPDCVRLCVEWLSAQNPARRATGYALAIKHMIEAWAGRYVSQSDVEAAAALIGLKGSYPRFWFKAGALVYPSQNRLRGMGEAGKHLNYRSARHVDSYRHFEV